MFNQKITRRRSDWLFDVVHVGLVEPSDQARDGWAWVVPDGRVDGVHHLPQVDLLPAGADVVSYVPQHCHLIFGQCHL